jgi:hypothetical protein
MRTEFKSDLTDILHQCHLGVFRGVGAGLFNLFAAFRSVGEPAPTGLLRIVQDVRFKLLLLISPLFAEISTA